ncbi:hypothetical protein BJY04DRAFT_183599 [Aspergillus karnatakaensis]|uniref:uncharacterized protein n=1 Tax=Aspergillus karnatakaensis TaxID=1810916 RepID=UPI003CCDB66D
MAILTLRSSMRVKSRKPNTVVLNPVGRCKRKAGSTDSVVQGVLSTGKPTMRASGRSQAR